ncbi:hypothetical protein DPMN_003641 [Dreissena polymorpha]|uniref:Uncharacterized protein n=1 Tax=Dreissena polymorpha TaxID=45954 RepID=A0A9D4RUX5_DREPO|nr:hypothetical protein DPMN_003641 [Dreissena polymorpha]
MTWPPCSSAPPSHLSLCLPVLHLFFCRTRQPVPDKFQAEIKVGEPIPANSPAGRQFVHDEGIHYATVQKKPEEVSPVVL